jgi:hypothetical protein
MRHLVATVRGAACGWLPDFTKALDRVTVPNGVPAATVAQLAWNVERLQAGGEIGERPSRYRRRRSGV